MPALGGPRIHERNGVCDLVATDPIAAAALVRRLLSFFPPTAIADPVAPEREDPGAALPPRARQVYDVRDVARGVVDGGSFVELGPRWARNLVTGLARLAGRPVAVVANQPRHLGGVLDAAASEKGARFVDLCDAHRLPLIVLVDTPGFMPGVRQESAGVIRHGAGLLRAFAGASVPRVTVILRKAYGGAYITMNSRDLGADAVFAWHGAELGVLGARAAVGLIRRRDLAAAPEPDAEQDRLAWAYAGEQLRRAVAAGAVDAVIAPGDTRRRLTEVLGHSEPDGIRNRGEAQRRARP